MLQSSARCRAIIGLAVGVLLLALALALAAPALAPARAQRSTGLPSGAVAAIAVHPRSPDTLAVVVHGSLFATDDGGAAWRYVDGPGRVGALARLAFGRDGEMLYVAGTLGLAMSADEGNSWQPIHALQGTPIAVLAVGPSDGALYAAAGGRLFRSPDGGATWQELAVPAVAGEIHALTPHPLAPQALYLGADGGLYVSGDRGASWYPIAAGLTAGPVHSVAAAHADGATLLLAVGARGARLSRDDGVTWTLAPAPPWATSLGAEGAAALVAWAALIDAGASEPPLGADERPIVAALASGDPRDLYLGTNLSLYAADDGGRAWRDLGGQGVGVASGAWRDSLAALPPYLAGIGVLLALVGAALWWRERRLPLGRRVAPAGREERWDDVIAEVLLRHHRVTPDLLERIPQHAREHAMTRYVDAHREQALVFQDDPPLILPARGERLRQFVETWTALVRDRKEPEAAVAAASRLIEQLCGLLGFEPVERRVYRSLAGYMVEAPTLRLSLPARFPVILLLKGELGREDLRDIRALMAALNAVSFFALLIPVSDDLQAAAPTGALQGLAREGAEDLIFLGYRELYGLHLAADAESDLVRRILGQVDLTVVSPYVLSGPVPPHMFFGRDYEIKLIMRTVQDRSFAIVGGRKIGKTSILNRVHRLLQQTEGYAPYYLDCHHVTTYQDFFEALSVMCEMSVESAAPDLLRRIVVRLRGRQSDPVRTVVFLLDEVDHLLRNDLEQGTLLFRVFRSLSQEGLCRFVLCGERTLDAALRDPDSPLFNFCSTLRLGYLQERDAERIVREPMQEMGISFEAPETAPQQIVALSGCHPNIVQAICQLLIERINQRQQRVIRAADLAEVEGSAEFRELFFEVSWGNATTLERLITVVMADRERFTPQEVRTALYPVGIALSDAELETALNSLALASLIKREGPYLTYTSPAFPRVLSEAGLAEGLCDGLAAKLLEEQA